MRSLFCPGHRHRAEMDIRDFQACPACVERVEDWYREADKTAREINRYRRG